MDTAVFDPAFELHVTDHAVTHQMICDLDWRVLIYPDSELLARFANHVLACEARETQHFIVHVKVAAIYYGADRYRIETAVEDLAEFLFIFHEITCRLLARRNIAFRYARTYNA